MSAPEPIVHVIDDEADVRQALALLMRSVNLKSRTYASAQEFLADYESGSPGCLVVDVRLPGMSGLELQERLTQAGIALPVIVMTGHGDIQMAVRAMRAGALDFVEKPFHDQALLDRVHEGIERSLHLQDVAGERGELQRRYASLTEREKQVMAQVIEGRQNKLIADELGLSTRTVETHRAHIIEKMGATSLSHLVRMAIAVMPQHGSVGLVRGRRS
ncbi:response regulator [Piscinibacter sp. XHJ-5]|uniref:response regulator transcription factor n=1 Tax=Piscinibacter sp. XHJ-5 TaxID=3037797 RepID=UPI0024534E25|nr:response regulator [Piscinibacter sp. XHJ-5]